MICFSHMIKTAGMTLQYIFRNNYGFNYVQVFQHVDFLRQLGLQKDEDFRPKHLNTLLHINKNIKAICGHCLNSVSALDSVYPDLKYITFLRDPIDRYISHYNHGRIRDRHSNSLEERTRSLSTMDYQTKFIIGAQNAQRMNYKAGLKELEKARKILANDFAFVGLVERFDESLILMKKILDLPNFDLRYEKVNVAAKRIVAKDELSSNLVEAVRKANEIDYELYRFVRDELYEKQKHKDGIGIIEDLENLNLYNKGYKFRRSQILNARIGKYMIYNPLFWLKYYHRPRSKPA